MLKILGLFTFILLGFWAFEIFGFSAQPAPTTPNLPARLSQVTNSVTFQRLIDRVVLAMRPLMREHNIFNIEVIPNWGNNFYGAGARIDSDTDPKGIQLYVNGGYARGGNQTEDSFMLAICHELGHILGGAPKNPRFPLSKGFYKDGTFEGQADYFATSKCLRIILQEDDNTSIISGLVPTEAAPESVARSCQNTWSDSQSRALCIRIALAARDFSRSLHWHQQTLRDSPQIGTPVPDFDQPDLSITERRYGNHPWVQCRLDILYQGALCPVPATTPFSDTDLNQGACPGGTIGARPACWLNPDHYPGSWRALWSSEKNDLRWNGVGHLPIPGAPSFYKGCTVTVLETVNERAPVYAVGAGHCFSPAWKSVTPIVAQPISMQVVLNAYYDLDPVKGGYTLPVIEVTYASTAIQDLALFRLGTTSKELYERGIKRYRLSSQAPQLGLVTTVGIPVSTSPYFFSRLTLQRCSVEDEVKIRENGWKWNALKTDCQLAGGLSGSSLFNVAQEIVAIANTRVEPGMGEPCSLGKPCEVNSHLTIVMNKTGTSYAIPVKPLSGCFDEQGIFQLQLSTCGLRR